MKTKTQKIDELKKLKDVLPTSGITIFTTFAREGEKGLSVAQMQELKRVLRAMGSSYTTAKKTLLEIALRDLKYDGVDVFGMQGSIGLVLGAPASTGSGEAKEDAYGIARKIYEFAKKNPGLQFFGAWHNGLFLTREQLLEMALMPSCEVLLGRLVGLLTYPMRGLAVVLKQIADKQPQAAV